MAIGDSLFNISTPGNGGGGAPGGSPAQDYTIPSQVGKNGKVLGTNGSILSWITAGFDTSGGITFDKNLAHTISVATQDDSALPRSLQIIGPSYTGGQAADTIIWGGDSLGPGTFEGGHLILRGGAGAGGAIRGGLDLGFQYTEDIFLGGSITHPSGADKGAVIYFKGHVASDVKFIAGSSFAITADALLAGQGVGAGTPVTVRGGNGAADGGKGGKGQFYGGNGVGTNQGGGDAVMQGGVPTGNAFAGSISIDGGLSGQGNNGGIYIGQGLQPNDIGIGFDTTTIIKLTGATTFKGNVLIDADKTYHIGTAAKMPTQIFAYQHAGQLQTLTGSGVVAAFDPTQGETIQFTETANVSSLTLTVGQIGQVITLRLIQSSNTGHTWPTTISNCKLAGGSFTKTTTANAVDTITLRCDGSNWYEVSRVLGLS